MAGWRFLLDENIDPKTVDHTDAGIAVEHVGEALGYGADDTADILPYAREHELIVVTSDVSDFGALDPEIHAGVVLVYDDTMAGHRVASALCSMAEGYVDPEAFESREVLDDWA